MPHSWIDQKITLSEPKRGPVIKQRGGTIEEKDCYLVRPAQHWQGPLSRLQNLRHPLSKSTLPLRADAGNSTISGTAGFRQVRFLRLP